MLLTQFSTYLMTLSSLTLMPNKLLTPKTTLMNKSEQQLLLSSPRSWRWTRNFGSNLKTTKRDSNKNLLTPRTTSLGTNLDKTKSTERLKLFQTTNATPTNFSCVQSRWTKKPSKQLSSSSKTSPVTLLLDNHSNLTKWVRLKFHPLLKSLRNTAMFSTITKSRASSNLLILLKVPNKPPDQVPLLKRPLLSLKNLKKILLPPSPTLNKTKLLLLGNSLDGKKFLKLNFIYRLASSSAELDWL